MGERLKGKVAVITGAGRGIGRGHALLFAAEGAKVVVNDLGGAADGSGASKGPADEVVDEIKKAGGEAVASYESVSTPEGGEKIIKAAIDNFGRLDIVVNNAGVLRDRMVFNMTEEEWDTVMKVHLYGTFNCSKPACVIFRQQRSGRIVNTSSTSGLGNRGQANYAAAKEGITGFTRTLARDMGRYGVTCNAIRPAAATRRHRAPGSLPVHRRGGECQWLLLLCSYRADLPDDRPRNLEKHPQRREMDRGRALRYCPAVIGGRPGKPVATGTTKGIGTSTRLRRQNG
jgi:NAD(P)-dependent dehydrogenase (short-subunit alcohol dehydrogenase family)